MKRIPKMILVLVVLVFFMAPIFFSQNKSNNSDVYVFLIDLSGSMRKDNLSERVKVELNNFIRDEVALNDKLLIMGFGDKVTLYYNGVISKTEEKGNTYNIISDLKSNHNWTHMSSAFNQLANRLDELNKLFPKSNKYVYIFTDGKNDPPPALNEEPELFQHILGKHFGMNKLKRKKSFVYYISLGREAPQEIVETAKKSENFKVTESPRKEKSIIPVEIELKLKDDSFKIIKGKRETIELKFKVLSISRASKIKINIENKEKILSLSKKKKKFDITFSPNKLSEGNHKMFINVSSMEKDGKVRPNKYKIAYRVVIPDYTFWYVTGGLLILIIIIVIILKMRPSFDKAILIFRQGDNEYPKILSGKSCKKLSDLQRGWGIPTSMKVCPSSTGSRIKFKFKLTEKQRKNLKKNGLSVTKSPEIIYTGDIIEYGDWEILYN